MSAESMLAVRYLPLVVSSRKGVPSEDIHIPPDVVQEIAEILRRHLGLSGIEEFNERGASLILVLSTSLVRATLLSELVRELVEVVSRLRRKVSEVLKRYYVSSRLLEEMMEVIDLGMSVDSACSVPPPNWSVNAVPLVMIVGLGIISDGGEAPRELRIRVPAKVASMLKQSVIRFFSVGSQPPEIPLRVRVYEFICRLEEALAFLWREVKRVALFSDWRSARSQARY